LSTEEADFASAMKSRNLRRKRRRRVAVTGAFVALLAVLAVVGAFGKRAERMANVSEARRFHMLAEKQMEVDNTLALALATASLEREDNPVVRKLALAALWEGPCRFVMPLPEKRPRTWWSAQMSPDGKWLATSTADGAHLWASGAETPLVLNGENTPVPYKTYGVEFNSTGNWLIGRADPQNQSDWESSSIVNLWSVPDARLHHAWRLENGPYSLRTFFRGDPPFILAAQRDDPGRPWLWQKYTTSVDGVQVLGRGDTAIEDKREFVVDPSGRYLLDWKGSDVFLFPLDSLESAPPILVGRHENDILSVAMDRTGKLIASTDMSGEIRVWDLDGGGEPIFRHQHDSTHLLNPMFDPSGNRLVLKSAGRLPYYLFDLSHPWAEPLRFLPENTDHWFYSSFTPDATWLIAPNGGRSDVWFYPLTGRHPVTRRIFPHSITEPEKGYPFRVLPNNKQIITQRGFPELWLRDLFSENPQRRLLIRHPEQRAIYAPIVDPLGRNLLARDSAAGRAWLIPLDGKEPRALGGFMFPPVGIALSPDARRAAVGGRTMRESTRGSLIRIWDLETDEVQDIDPGHDDKIKGLWFLSDGRLISASEGGLRIWNPETGDHEVLSKRAHLKRGELDASEQFLVINTPDGVTLWDLELKTERILPLASEETSSLSIAPDGSFIMAGSPTGEVRYLSLESNQPHLLFGHDEVVTFVKITPEGDGILSLSGDGTMREWAIPQGRPLFSRPLDDLIKVLHAQTNMRIVTDVDAEEGYRITYDRFLGWETTPEW